ncbi:MAG: hypothetical protein V5A64_00685 [Candidatus Thermoplasmatota archaeon]
MVKKVRRARTFARTASKSMEKHIIENAKQIKENPYLVLPEYDDKYSKKYFKKPKKKISKVEDYIDNPEKLEKLSKKRDISGAVAGTITIAHSEKAPYLAVAKLPDGEITYAKRGRADKEDLIAVQHFDSPVLRLLGIKDLVLKKKLHVYSWSQGFVSTGREANPPKEFIDFLIDHIGVAKKNDHVAGCKHLSLDQIKNNKKSDFNFLKIHWKSGDQTLAVCEKCAQKEKQNIVYEISKYLVEPDISKDFQINVVGSIVKDDVEQMEHETEFIDQYISGKLSDYEIIDKNMQERVKKLMDSDEQIFVLDDEFYGDDVEAFIDALNPNQYERKGLQFILERTNQPVIVNDATPNTVLEKFWEDYGSELIREVVDDEDVAEKFLQLRDPPSKILETVYSYREQKKILSRLPKYQLLPKYASFVDKIARTYKTLGKEKALNVVKENPADVKGRSIAYGFLLAFGKAKDKKWKFSEVEVELGVFLKDFAEKLLESKPEEYHENLQKLIDACGLSENVDDKLIEK